MQTDRTVIRRVLIKTNQVMTIAGSPNVSSVGIDGVMTAASFVSAGCVALNGAGSFAVIVSYDMQ